MRMWVICAVLSLAGLTPDLARACEPLGYPRHYRETGVAAVVATVVSMPAGEFRADVLMGRTDTDAMARGRIVLVPWSYGADCKPLSWNTNMKTAWSPPATPAVYTGTLRLRDRWIDGLPTVDVYMAALQPIWKGAPPPQFTPQEFFDFYFILPTSQEMDERRPAALARVVAWESANPQLAAREPAQTLLRNLHWFWTRRVPAGL